MHTGRLTLARWRSRSMSSRMPMAAERYHKVGDKIPKKTGPGGGRPPKYVEKLKVLKVIIL